MTKAMEEKASRSILFVWTFTILAAVSLTSALFMALLVYYRTTDTIEGTDARLLMAAVGIGLAVILCAFTAAFFLSRRLTIPIARLTEAADQMASGDLNIPLPSVKFRELRSLSHALERMRRELKLKIDALRESSLYVRNLVESNPDPMVAVNLEGKITDVNAAAEAITGLDREHLVGSDCTLYSTDPERVRNSLIHVLEEGRVTGYPLAVRHVSGTVTDVLLNASVYRNVEGEVIGILATVRDTTELKRIEERLRRSEEMERGENRILTLIGTGAGLPEILDAIVLFGEKLDPSIKASILLYDARTDYLFHASAPSLPDDYNALLEKGLLIGPSAGSCGSAAYLKKRIIVADIQTDPRWTPYKIFIEKTREHGLRACWSEPILSSKGDVLGSIANYCDRTGYPTADNLQVLEWSARVAALAIENDRKTKAIEESKRRLSSVIETQQEMICRFLPDTTLTFVNGAFCRAFDRKEHDLLGRKFLELVPESEHEVILDTIGKTRDTGQSHAYMHWSMKQEGGISWHEWICSIIEDSMGRTAQLQSVGRDVTERKLAEEKIRESEERFRTLAENIPGVVYLCDNDERYTTRYVNEYIGHLTGYSKNDFMENRISLVEMYHPEDTQGIRSVVDAALHKREPFHLTYRLRRRDGAWRWVEEWGTGIYDGENLRFIEGFIVDVTEKIQMSEMLQQARKMETVGRLAGGVAHDFNNLLGVILGYTDMALDQLSEDSPLYGDLQEIQKAAERSVAIVLQLLAFARRQTTSPRILDLNKTIEGMFNILRNLVGDNIRVVRVPSQDICPVNMDSSQIDQIVVNLCINSRDAIEGRGTITIETGSVILDETTLAGYSKFSWGEQEASGEYVMLAVNDDGCGMSEEILGNLFEPFFTTKEVGKGTGLGLPTVYGIVKQNRGFIHVDSEPGRGTTFKIFLPRHEG